MIQIFLFFISFCIFKDFIAMEVSIELKNKQSNEVFIPNHLLSKIKGGLYKSKGKLVTGFLNDISASALNDYVQKNPHFLPERVKAMGIEVLSSETEKQLKDNQLGLTRLNNEVLELQKTLDAEKLKHNTLEQEKNTLNAKIKDIEELRKNKEIEFLEIKNRYELQQTETNQKLETLTQREADYTTELNNLQQKIHESKNLIDLKTPEFDELKQNYLILQTKKEELETLINEKIGEVAQLIYKNENLETQKGNLEKVRTENERLKKAFFGLMVTNFILGAGYVLFSYRHLIKNGFVSLWQLKNIIPSVSFKKPNISFPTFSNPFSNFQIGNQIALYWALLRNRFGI